MVTVNDYLARRDAEWMGKLYDFFGLSVGCIQNQTISYIYDPSVLEEITLSQREVRERGLGDEQKE